MKRITVFRKSGSGTEKVMKKIALPTAGLIVVKQNQLLLAYSKNKKAWYLPGGKIDTGENPITALQREIKEELNIHLKSELIEFYYHISAPAYGETPNIIMEQDCFIYPLEEEVEAGNEIEAVQYFDFEAYKNESIQVVGVLNVFSKLIEDKIIYPSRS